MPGPRDDANQSEDVREALECVQYLSQWFRRDDDDNPRIGWAEAVNAVKNEAAGERAAFTVMGDWANGLLASDLQTGNVRSTPFPGTGDVFVYTSDTFPLPIGATPRTEVRALLETIASPEAQLAFSAKKGSFPARDGIDLGSLHSWQRETADAFESLPKAIATSGLFPPYYPQGDLGNALRAMTAWPAVAGPDGTSDERARLVDEALRLFTDLEPLLDLWQDRLASGPAPAIRP